MGREYRKRVDGQDQIIAKFVMLPRRVRAGGAGRLDNSGVKAKRRRGAYMSFLHKIFGSRPAPATGKPVAKGKLSAQMAFLQAKADEKLSLLRYLATCGQMDATKLDAYLSMFEDFGNPLGPEKRAYILKSAPMMAPKLEGGRVLNGYERLRWSFFQTHIEEVDKVLQMMKELPVEPASAELQMRILKERGELQRQAGQGRP